MFQIFRRKVNWYSNLIQWCSMERMSRLISCSAVLYKLYSATKSLPYLKEQTIRQSSHTSCAKEILTNFRHDSVIDRARPISTPDISTSLDVVRTMICDSWSPENSAKKSSNNTAVCLLSSLDGEISWYLTGPQREDSRW